MRPLIALILMVLIGQSAGAAVPAFVRDVDVSTLNGLGAKQAGRVVPLRSFAEAFMTDVHGDTPMVAVDGTAVDPLVTLLESVFHPERAMEWCTVASPGRAAPRRAGDTLEQLAFGLPGGDFDATQTSDLALLEARLALIVFASEELLIAPGEAGAPWLSIDDARHAEHGALIDRLATAWRLGDAPTVNSALADLSAALQRDQRVAGVRPWILNAERLLDRVPLLSISVLLYILSAVLASLKGFRIACLFAGMGLLVHIATLACRAIVLDRIPVQNHYESMATVASIVACGGVLMAWRSKQPTMLAIGTALAGVLLAIAEWLDVPGRLLELEAGILSSTAILKYHVLTILAGYALILFGAGIGSVLLVQRATGNSADRIADLHRMQTRLGYWAFWVLGLGIFLGAVWADRAWGRWWAFDPKETWALITWLVYLAMVHIPASRLAPSRQPVIVAILHLLGLLAMLWTYFGVNLLLPSLHSYA
jgi:ABC-type transport system involved in cytochrome c biogenesis permease subunit